MQLVSIDQLELPPGELVVWTPSASADLPSDVPPSFNQRNHVLSAGTTGGWLAVSFDLPVEPGAGPDLDALAAAFAALVDRHQTLRTSLRRGTREAERRLHPGPLTWRMRTVRLGGTLGERRRQLAGELDRACRADGFGDYLLGLVRAPGVARVICGFSHVHVDAVSLALVVRDVLDAYAGRRPDGAAGSFVDYCAEEAAAEPADPEVLTGWHRFFDAHGDARAGALPRFPADLGIGPGQRAGQHVVVEQLLDDRAATEFEHRCAGAGAGSFAGVLAACARSARQFGAAQLAAVVPVSTRRDARWANALGWFVTNVALSVPADQDVLAGAACAQAELSTALATAGVPLGQVLAGYDRPLDLDRDLFMISFLDYRRLPGAAQLLTADAHHVSASTPADDVQLWFSRTDRGLALRCRHPDTAIARATVRRWLDGTHEALQQTISEGVRAWR